MTRRIAVIAMVFLSCVSMVFAGGQAESDNQDATLRMLWWGGNERHTPTLEALDLYMAKNPGIVIEGEYQGWDGYYQRVITQLAGGTSADILQIDQPWLNELCSKGDIFLDIDTSIVDISGFDQKFLEDYCSFEGRLVGLPTGINTYTMLVDTAVLEQFGIDPDTIWTWDSIVSEGKKMHEADPSYYLNGADPDKMRMWWEMYVTQLAGGIIDEDKNILFTEEQATQAFEYFKQWFDYGIVPPFAQTSLFYKKWNENPDWINGKIALGISWVSSMAIDMGSRIMETRPLPVFDRVENSGVIMRPSQLYVITSTTSNAAESMKVMNFLLNDPEAAVTLKAARGIPAVSSARETLMEQGFLSELELKAIDDGIAQAGSPQSSYQMNSDVMQAMQDVIDEFGYGNLTPEEAASKMITSIEDALARL